MGGIMSTYSLYSYLDKGKETCNVFVYTNIVEEEMPKKYKQMDDVIREGFTIKNGIMTFPNNWFYFDNIAIIDKAQPYDADKVYECHMCIEIGEGGFSKESFLPILSILEAYAKNVVNGIFTISLTDLEDLLLFKNNGNHIKELDLDNKKIEKPEYIFVVFNQGEEEGLNDLFLFFDKCKKLTGIEYGMIIPTTVKFKEKARVYGMYRR